MKIRNIIDRLKAVEASNLRNDLEIISRKFQEREDAIEMRGREMAGMFEELKRFNDDVTRREEALRNKVQKRCVFIIF